MPRRLGARALALAAAVVLAVGCGGAASDVAPVTQAVATSADAPRAAPRVKPRVIAVRPHDPTAFTQGLVWHQGHMYESTGLYGRSEVRRVAPDGRVLARTRLPRRNFGEGLATVGDRLYQLTWREGTAFVWRRSDLSAVGTRAYEGEGWGLTTMGRRLVMSDGSATLRVIDPATFKVVRRIPVRDGGQHVTMLNELEVVHGRIWANVWRSDDIVVIDPRTGMVTTRIDMSSLRRLLPRGGRSEVLNGIAWDRDADRVYITGKWWPRMFVVRPIR